MLTEIEKISGELSGLIVLAGDPGIGKTSFALQIAYEMAERGTSVIFYSYNMPKRELILKMISRLCRMSRATILASSNEQHTKEEIERLHVAQTQLKKINAQLTIRTNERDEDPMTITNIEHEVHLQKEKSLVFILDPLEYPLENVRILVNRTNATCFVITDHISKNYQSIADGCILMEMEKNEDISPLFSDFMQNKGKLYMIKHRYGRPCCFECSFYPEIAHFTIL